MNSHSAQAQGAERRRLEAAITALAAERGFAGTDAAAVCRRAGLGEEVFARHFASPEDCFCAAMQSATEALLARVGAAFAAAADGWRNQIRAVAYVMLAFFQEDPARARLMVVESPLAGARSRRIRDDGRAALAALLDRARSELPDPAAVSPTTTTATVTAGAISNRIQVAVEADDLDALPAMVPELMYTAVKPYFGTEAALEELHIPPPPGDARRSAPRGSAER